MNFVTNSDVPPTHEEWQKRPANEQIMITQFAQQMESLGILVAERLINIDLVDKTLGSFVTTSWEKYKTVFLDIREKQPDPFLGEYFQWLAERFDVRGSLFPASERRVKERGVVPSKRRRLTARTCDLSLRFGGRVGGSLIVALLENAKQRGIRRVSAEVHPGNSAIERTLESSGFDPERRTLWGLQL